MIINERLVFIFECEACLYENKQVYFLINKIISTCIYFIQNQIYTISFRFNLDQIRPLVQIVGIPRAARLGVNTQAARHRVCMEEVRLRTDVLWAVYL